MHPAQRGPERPGEEAGLRFAGVDHGGRWFGIALSDLSGMIARPLALADGEAAAVALLRKLIAEEEVGTIVVGLPRNLDGALGPRAKEVLRFAEALRGQVPVPVETWDERLTSREAQRYLRLAGLGGRKLQEKENQVAAQILLQNYLDAQGAARRRAEEPPELPLPEEEEGGADEAEGPEDPQN